MPRSRAGAGGACRPRCRSTPACAGSASPRPSSSASIARLLDALDLRLVMSHLACAEEPDNPAERAAARALRAAAQAACRRRRRASPTRPGSSSGRRSTASSAGRASRCTGSIRPRAAPTRWRRWSRSRRRSCRSTRLPAPGSVGYGATYRTRAGMRIATVPVGYADGYLRAASGRATARIAGQEVPLAGRVSMDLISLDVSALPADAVRPGTMVELIGGPDGRRPLGRGRGHDRLRSTDATWQPVRASVYPARQPRRPRA